MNNSSYITTIRITVVLLLIAAIPTVAGVAVAESPTATNNTGIDFGIELQQEATVSQGGNTTIDAYPRNRDDRAVSGTTVELLVDADDDGVFDRTDESVASRTVDFSAEEYRTVSLQYSNVQLNPGNYSYRAILSKDGQTNTSFTDGTLTVQQAAGIDFGIELQQEATVAQGGNTTIDAYPRNRDDRAVSGTTVELLVDADDDGVFNRTGDSVASQTVDFSAEEYRTVSLQYSNVQLAPGNYSYRAILSKDGQTNTSFTDGTLTVQDAAGIDFGIELQQEATVSQGGNTTIDAYPRNRDDRAVSGTTVELLVDADDDGVFNRTGDSVASQTVDFSAGEYRTVSLQYSNVQLAPGNYSYRAILSKDGQTNTSFTDGTLTVQAAAGIDFGIELQQEATVAQGGSTTIDAYPRNRDDRAVSGTTVELLVDADDDGVFDRTSESVASQTVDFSAGEYRTVSLQYNNVQLAPGNYSYRAILSKDGQTETSFTDGTLTVQAAAGIDFGIELQQEATVAQGGNTTIDAYPRNRDNRAVSGTTVQLLVDADDDGVFNRTGESVASQTVDFNASEYRTVPLEYSNVQLAPGNYSYRAILSKDGQTETSFTDGTLTVQAAAGIDFGIELQQEATVAQGGSTTIDAYPRNRDNRAVSGTTVELLVDADDDGVFNRTGESVASQTVDFSAGEYRTVSLQYNDVQLAPGNYSYRAILSKDGQTETSFTDGTLTVEADDDNSDSGLSRFDTDDDGEIGFLEVITAINAYNNDTQIGGEDVKFIDVIDAIDAFNSDTAV